MKLTKHASGKQVLKISKSEWEEIGQKQGWLKQAQVIGLDTEPDMSGATKVQKKAIPLDFEILREDTTVQTKEGPVGASAGDVLMTGTQGEQWPIPKGKFDQTYDDLGAGKAAKKAIPVLAKQMSEPFQVKVSWSESLLNGKIGDWLVAYGPGDYGVVDQGIFNETYEML